MAVNEIRLCVLEIVSCFILLFEFLGAVVSYPPTFPRASGLNRSVPRAGHETAKLHPSGGNAINIKSTKFSVLFAV